MFTLLLLVVLLGILGVQVPRYLRKKSSSPCSFLHNKKKRKSKTSEISAEDCISQKNWHYCLNDPMFGFGVPAWLMNMDKTDPARRGLNDDDYRLKKNANKLGNDLCVLGYLSTYGHLENTFFEGYIDAQNDLQFQSRIISIYKNDIRSSKKDYYSASFANLVCGFLKRWDFAPEIKKIIFRDERFESIKRIYDLYRNRATGELLTS